MMTDRTCNTCAYSDIDGRPILGVHRCRVCHDDLEHPRWEPDAAVEVPGAAQSVAMLPLATEEEQKMGWTLSYSFLLAIASACSQRCDALSMEQVETVLLEGNRTNVALKMKAIKP